MIKLNPRILETEGKKSFVILTWEEYEAVREALADAEDLRLLRDSRQQQKDQPTISHEQMKQGLDLE
jgi:PHD/YefM family antitoxin component YafN of YafNO toxin-antitoxin module